MGRIDERMLQRLVDGELDERSYRETLLMLADDPDGWRHCALAFLEDQWLHRQLVCAPPQEKTAPTAPGTKSRPRVLSWLLAIAASFTLAFIGGYEVSQWRKPLSLGRVAADLSQPSFQKNPHVRDSNSTQMASQRAGQNQVGLLHLVVDGPDGAGEQPIELPVYALDENSSQWLMDDRSSFPPQMFEALEQTGQQVRRSKFWAPVNLQDGRQLVIPVEQLEITPVSQPY